MPKKRQELQVRGEDVRRWIREGRLHAFPAGTNRVLRVHRAFRATFPPVKVRDKSGDRRMTISAGSFLNSRWIKVNNTWDVWPDILRSTTAEDIDRLRARSIISVGGHWYIQIYEVVSGVNKLRRQRVKIGTNYHREKTQRAVVMGSIERDIARDAAGLIKLSSAERRSLEALNWQIERRIQDIDSIGSRLSPREVFAYAGGWAELETFKRIRNSLREAVRQPLVGPFASNFDRYLLKQVDVLGGIVNLDVRHNRFWAQFHLRRAAEVLVQGPQGRFHHYLGRAIEYLDGAIETLQGWADTLSVEEKDHALLA